MCVWGVAGRLTPSAPDIQSIAMLPATSSGFPCWIKFVRRTQGTGVRKACQGPLGAVEQPLGPCLDLRGAQA